MSETLSEALSKRCRLLKQDGLLKMFTHPKLKVYQKALRFVASIESLSIHWERSHSFVDHLIRASESIVLNIAEAARPLLGTGKVVRLDYSIGSALECAACLDIAKIKNLISASDAFDQRRGLWEITRMLIGLRKSWLPSSLQEESVDITPGKQRLGRIGAMLSRF